MRISARNQLKGKVVDLKEGAVNSKVTIELPGGERITSIITIDSVKELGLEIGKDAFAIVKASNVMIGVDE